MKFDEFHPGQRLAFGPAIVSEADMLAFARTYDPQWFHVDPARAQGGRWNGLIASGWQTCAVAMRLVVVGALQGSESFGSPGLEYLKWLAPVRPGDALTVHAEVLDTRRSTRQSSLGILRWRWIVENQRDVPVLDLIATSFFDLVPAPGGGALQ
ncbi:MAG: MaoC family dehydratase [Betaproteobacteria bacterium]